MKTSIVILAVVLIGVAIFLLANKQGNAQADVEAAISRGELKFIALLDPEGTMIYPQVPGIPDWYFQGAGILVRQTKPETLEKDVIYMKSYNEALERRLKAQGKFHLIEEGVARAKANLEKKRP